MTRAMSSAVPSLPSGERAARSPRVFSLIPSSKSVWMTPGATVSTKSPPKSANAATSSALASSSSSLPKFIVPSVMALTASEPPSALVCTVDALYFAGHPDETIESIRFLGIRTAMNPAH
jgi:hypothetical protein